jgi:hypothetical protein
VDGKSNLGSDSLDRLRAICFGSKDLKLEGSALAEGVGATFSLSKDDEEDEDGEGASSSADAGGTRKGLLVDVGRLSGTLVGSPKGLDFGCSVAVDDTPNGEVNGE